MTLNVNSIRRRLTMLEAYIDELKKQQRIGIAQFEQDRTRQLAVERAFQAAIEACIDIAGHIASVYELGHPEESRDVFRYLVEANYLEPGYGEAMMQMVSLRNRLVHLYWDVDLNRLYEYLQTDTGLLEKFQEFVIQVLAAEDDT